MEVSQPLLVAAAFIAGFGFMFLTRLVWSLISSSFQFLLIAGVLLIVVSELNGGKLSGGDRPTIESVQDTLRSGARIAQGALSSAKEWLAGYDVQLTLRDKKSR